MNGETRRWYWLRIAAAAAFVIALVAVVDVASRGSFLEPSNIVRVLRQITYNCVLGVGQTFVIITGGIDLSVGSLVALTGVVAALFANSVHLSGFPLIAATLIVALGVGSLAGWVNALPVVRLNLPPFITTLAMLEMAVGASFILSHGRPIALKSGDFQNTGIGSFLGGVTSALHLPSIPVPV
ncbi:MAG TPA: ABC transporter permease, partial [Candidatus Cybelea sp.]|nr:ABC transporter permease [Candidatus Cybelea sp.]